MNLLRNRLYLWMWIFPDVSCKRSIGIEEATIDFKEKKRNAEKDGMIVQERDCSFIEIHTVFLSFLFFFFFLFFSPSSFIMKTLTRVSITNGVLDILTSVNCAIILMARNLGDYGFNDILSETLPVFSELHPWQARTSNRYLYSNFSQESR